MSRSYKKNPIVKDGHSGKVGKRFANRKVRNFKGSLPSGKAYRKVFNSWDIHDFVNRFSYLEYQVRKEAEEKKIQQGVQRTRFVMTKDKWEKYYKRK